MAGELQLRMDVSQKLAEGRMYRQIRRSNKTQYRPPRITNRQRKKGWLTPSIQHKLDSHLRFLQTLQQRLPITRIRAELGTVDPQKLQNPEIRRVEYQHEELRGYEVLENLLHKWDRTMPTVVKRIFRWRLSILSRMVGAALIAFPI